MNSIHLVGLPISLNNPPLSAAALGLILCLTAGYCPGGVYLLPVRGQNPRPVVLPLVWLVVLVRQETLSIRANETVPILTERLHLRIRCSPAPLPTLNPQQTPQESAGIPNR